MPLISGHVIGLRLRILHGVISVSRSAVEVRGKRPLDDHGGESEAVFRSNGVSGGNVYRP